MNLWSVEQSVELWNGVVTLNAFSNYHTMFKCRALIPHAGSELTCFGCVFLAQRGHELCNIDLALDVALAVEILCVDVFRFAELVHAGLKTCLQLVKVFNTRRHGNLAR